MKYTTKYTKPYIITQIHTNTQKYTLITYKIHKIHNIHTFFIEESRTELIPRRIESRVILPVQTNTSARTLYGAAMRGASR